MSYAYTDRIQANTDRRDVVPWYGFKIENGLIQQGVRQNADGTFAVDPAAFEATGTVAAWLELSRLRPEANLSTLVTENGAAVLSGDGPVRFSHDRKPEAHLPLVDRRCFIAKVF